MAGYQPSFFAFFSLHESRFMSQAKPRGHFARGPLAQFSPCSAHMALSCRLRLFGPKQSQGQQKRVRNENEPNHPTILPNKFNKPAHRKQAFPACMAKVGCQEWARFPVLAHTNINQNMGLASSYPFAEQDIFFCLLVYSKVLSESTSNNRPQVRSIKENT